jgi:hypothetical protein
LDEFRRTEPDVDRLPVESRALGQVLWLLAFGFVGAAHGQAAGGQSGVAPAASAGAASDGPTSQESFDVGPFSLGARVAVERWDDPRFERLTGDDGGARFVLDAAHHRGAWSLGLSYEPVVEQEHALRPALSVTSRHAAAQLSGTWRRAFGGGWSLGGGIGVGFESLSVVLASGGEELTTEDRAAGYGFFAAGGRELAPGFAVELRVERRLVEFELGEALGQVRGDRWQIGTAVIYRNRGPVEQQ